MRYEKFFELAKEAGIEEAELYISESHSLRVSLFHGETDNYSDNNGMNIIARGIINGKFGAASCDVWNLEKAKYLVAQIKANAAVIENDDPVFIFEGSPKYKKINVYNNDLAKISIDEKLNKLHQLEEAMKIVDERIIEIGEVEYSENIEKVTLLNSKGLKLSQKTNYFAYFGQAVAKQGEQVKSGYDFFFDNDFSKFDVEKLAKKIVDQTVAQLGGEPCSSDVFKAVLAPEVVRAFMSALISHADAEEVQKQSSLFINKLNEKIVSSKVTIEDKAIFKNPFARWFDDEGVATYNKPIIKNGVLQTYLYNLTTAAKDGVASTGNASRSAGKMYIEPHFLYLKPGKKSQEELFKDVGDGVYITEVSGLHAGLNQQSGNFSLQSTGFLIKDGKKDRPLDIITVSGNLLEIFKDVVEIANDETVSPYGACTESVFVKKLTVSGK